MARYLEAMRDISRREWFRRALALPAGAWLARYEALAQPHRGKTKITAIRAMQMQIQNLAGNCLIKIETVRVSYSEL